MGPEDLKNLLTAKPFVPFRMRLDDGQAFEIRHPDMLWVGRRVAVLLIFEPGPEHYLERHVTVALIHITTVEPVEAAQAG